jgi:predicted aspartyl protease
MTRTFGWLLLFTAVKLLPAQSTCLAVERLAHTMVLRQVYLNGQGPFRMMIDTGASSSSVRPQVAARIGIRPLYAVELVTPAGAAKVAALRVQVKVGGIADDDVELLEVNAAMRGVDGVLGQTWLSRHSYLLDYGGKQLVLDPPAPEEGLRLQLHTTDGRPGISAVVDRVEQDLVIDSGASTLVLFRRPTSAFRAKLLTNQGTAITGVGMAVVEIGNRFKRRMATAELESSHFAAGLLPADAFRSVYVSNREGAVVLAPR